MEEIKEADWRPNWDEISDLMRPIGEEAAAAAVATATMAAAAEPAPEAEIAPRKSYGQALWNEKKDEEDRQQRKLARQMRRLWDSHEERDATVREKRDAWQKLLKLRTNYVMAFLRHYAPYALLLLLAPQMNHNIVFFSEGEAIGQLPYWLILGAATLPLALLSLWLRPIGDHPFFRFSALLLPIELYFMLRFASRTGRLWLPFALLILCTLSVLISHLGSLSAGTRKAKKSPAPDGNFPSAVEAAIAQKHLEDFNGDKPSLMKEHWRRVLCYSVPCMAALLLVFAVAGALPEPRDDGLFTAIAQEEARYGLSQLSQKHWAGLSSREKREAMQLLLNLEADALNISRFSLGDESIFSLGSREIMSVRRALRTGKAQAEARIRAVCYAAYYRMQELNAAPEQFDAAQADKGAAAYADARAAHYMQLIETYFGE